MAELERYRLLVESIQDYAIFILDKAGRVMTWNKGAEKFKGYKANEIIGKHFSVFYLAHDKAAKKPERELEIAQQFGRVEDEDWRLRKDGTQFWANVIITALRDETGNLVGYAKVTRDLTVRKQREDKMRKTNLLLRQQEEELRQLNLSKDEFVSLASHQLRTPATSIKQFLGMLLEGFMGEMTPDQQRCVERAYESNEHQITTINNLLQVAQIDAGKVTLRKEPTDIKELLNNVVEEHVDKFKSRQQRAVVEVPRSLPDVPVDVGYFRMVLENLVDNASKYTPKRGVIKLSAHKRNGDKLKVSIRDNGVGIAKEDVPRLFLKFSRIPNVLSADVGGVGLGLYWVNKIVSLHDGWIDVESEVDKGTTFSIYI